MKTSKVTRKPRSSTSKNKPIVYTISSCPASLRLKQDFTDKGIAFDERQVDKNQKWLNEALEHGDTVPLVVFPDGRVEIGYPGMIG